MANVKAKKDVFQSISISMNENVKETQGIVLC